MAAEEPERLLNDSNTAIDEFLCRALRGEATAWPEAWGEGNVESVKERIAHHGLTSLVYHQLHEVPAWVAWPLDLSKWMEQTSKAEIAKELLSAHYLGKLLAAFSQRGITPLLVKGEALARTHYQVPGTRIRGDVDLFIHFDDIKSARMTLEECGYGIFGPIYKCHQWAARPLNGDSASVEFDVHWRILNAPRFARSISFEEAMKRSRNVPGLDNCRTLNAADALMLACMHLAGSEWHDRGRLIWIYDIHSLVLSMDGLELQQFAERAVEKTVQSACFSGLARARACFGTKLPGEVMTALQTAEPSKTLSRRFAESQLGLLTDDLKRLPDFQSRLALVAELFLPSGASLLEKYGKTSKLWLPWLYCKQITGGLWLRLTLR